MRSARNHYTLIQFVDELGKKKSVDFVPTEWIHYDSELDDICTRFLPLPYDDKNLASLHGMVKCRISPPNIWPKFRVDIKGEAKTYDEAEHKLKILETKNYAFSTDCEDHARAKASASKKWYLKKKNHPDEAEVENLMKVPSMSSDEDSPTKSSPISNSSPSPNKPGTTRHRVRQRRSPKKNAKRKRSDEFSSSDTVVMEKSHHISAKETVRCTNTRKKQTSQTKKSFDTCQRSLKNPTDAVKTTSTQKWSRPIAKPSAQVDDGFDDLPSPDVISFKKSNTSTRQGSFECTVVSNKKTSKEKKSVDSVLPAKPKSKPSTHDEEDDLKAVFLKSFRSLSIQQTRTSAEVQEVKNLLESIIVKLNSTQERNEAEQQECLSLAERLEINFPLDDLEDFEKFDNALKDRNFKHQLNKEMWVSIDHKSSLKRSVSNIMKKFMSRDLIRKYTAVKQTQGKLVFKSTTFSTCIRGPYSGNLVSTKNSKVFSETNSISELITSEFAKDARKSPINDNKFFEAVSSVVNNAKDWEGHRLLRANKQQPAVRDNRHM